MSSFYKIPLIIYFFHVYKRKTDLWLDDESLTVGRYGKHGPDFETLINHHC